jgi:uncharacterized protein (TIGR03083 family)
MVQTTPLAPITTIDLLPEIQAALLALLDTLPADEWTLPTACEGWSVKDVAAHMLASTLGILSAQRDQQHGTVKIDDGDWAALVAFIDHQNDVWVRATRRLSPRVICDLLKFGGDQLITYFRTLDPFAPSVAVSWAGSERAPVWLEIAREYTEFWTHQQHIRDAVGRPGMTDARYMKPLLEAFARALPRTYRDVQTAPDAVVKLEISGEGGGAWYLLRETDQWILYSAVDLTPACVVRFDTDTAWRLFTKGITREVAQSKAVVEGDTALGSPIFSMVSMIV